MVNQLNGEFERCNQHQLSGIYVVVFAYFVFATILAIVSWRGLVADGVGYFLSLLGRRWPSTFATPRIFAHVIVQWPVVFALRAGVTDITTLLYVHSFGLYYLGPLQLILCYLIVPRDKKIDLIWPLISLFAGSINAWFVAVTESHVMTFIFWPLVLFMLHGRIDRRICFVVFLTLTCASLGGTGTYPSGIRALASQSSLPGGGANPVARGGRMVLSGYGSSNLFYSESTQN